MLIFTPKDHAKFGSSIVCPIATHDCLMLTAISQTKPDIDLKRGTLWAKGRLTPLQFAPERKNFSL